MQETPHRLNPERHATCTSHFAAEPASELDTMNEGTSNYASSHVHISQVLKLMGCDEHKNCVRTLPSIEIRRQVIWASDREMDHASMTKIQNVGIKAWTHVLLPNLRLNEGSKKSCSLQSPADHGSTHINMADIHMDSQVLTTIPTNIRDILKGEKLLTSYNSTVAVKIKYT